MDALDVLCAQLTCDLFAIAKFLFVEIKLWRFYDLQYGGRSPSWIFSWTLLRYVRLMKCRLSVCLSTVCLSVICNVVAPWVETGSFRQYFAPPNSSGIWTICVKILGKNLKGFWGIVQVKYKVV